MAACVGIDSGVIVNSAIAAEDQLDLLKNAIHAVRSPASSIWDLADTVLATKQETLDEQTRTDIAQIQDLARQVLAAADAMAMLMRVEIVEPSLVSVEIADVVGEAIRRYDASHGVNRKTVHVSLPPEMPLVDVAPEWIAQATYMLICQCSYRASQNTEINLSITMNDGFVTVSIIAEHPADIAFNGIWALELLTVDRIMMQHQGKFWTEKCADQIAGYNYSLPVVAP